MCPVSTIMTYKDLAFSFTICNKLSFDNIVKTSLTIIEVEKYGNNF